MMLGCYLEKLCPLTYALNCCVSYPLFFLSFFLFFLTIYYTDIGVYFTTLVGQAK